jgi:hypothetical protein
MEISEVRRQLTEAIERAKRAAADRRANVDEASREYAVFLEQIAVPLFRQVANVLKVQGYPFAVFTPGGSVRLMSEKNSDDFIELSLDTTGEEPIVMGHSRRGRGRRVLESERPIGEGPVRNLTEEKVLRFLLEELEPFVEK